jgi:hypothetical protein
MSSFLLRPVSKSRRYGKGKGSLLQPGRVLVCDKSGGKEVKLFFIFAAPNAKDKNIAVLISAFANIDSFGQAHDMIEAIEIIQTRYPEAMLADDKSLAEKPEVLTSLLDEGKSPLIVLPEDHKTKEASVYVGLDLSSVDPLSLDWLIKSILKIIEECYGRQADR